MYRYYVAFRYNRAVPPASATPISDIDGTASYDIRVPGPITSTRDLLPVQKFIESKGFGGVHILAFSLYAEA